MKAYLHKLYTEAHRRYKRSVSLASALEAEGIEISLHLDSSCQVAICGAFCMAEEFGLTVHRHDEFLRETNQPRIPTVQLCFDLYPMHVNGTRSGMNDTEKVLWDRYVKQLSKAHLVIAPSASAARRIEQFTHNPRVSVVYCACDPWWQEIPSDGQVTHVPLGDHVLDVLRPLDDWGQGKVKYVCDQLGIPCVESKCSLGFQAFKEAVCNARLLVSGYDEASTGGLTLLEGYALGKQVLLSDSHWNGASEYFYQRANYFEAGDEKDLKDKIRILWGNPQLARPDHASWVQANFSDQAMAKALAKELRKLTL